MSDFDQPNADIMVRKRHHKIFFCPETLKAENWLIEQSDCFRPPHVENDDRLSTQGYRGACRGFAVDKPQFDAVWKRAEDAGLIVRRQPR